jgi:GNAT superfamily N-acetyltransferase
VEILDIDPRDDRAFAAWFAVVDAVAKHDRPDETGWLPEELRAGALDGRPADDGTPPVDERRELLLLRDAGRPIGYAQLELPLSDNQHLAVVSLGVLPDHRRAGAGRVLLRATVERARRSGRTTLVAEADEPPELLGRSPGRAFATAEGFSCAISEVRRDLVLPVPDEHLDAVDAAALPHAAGYRAFSFADRWPDELVAERADLGRRMSLDAPLGELDWREERWDAARIRRQEELFRRQGRLLVAAGVMHEATGALVAFTELAVPLALPDRAWQWDTLVVGEHRGHRLGTLVKTAALRRLQKEVPAVRRVTTHNADTNAYMIAVNEALGFRPNGVLSEWQRAL